MPASIPLTGRTNLADIFHPDNVIIGLEQKTNPEVITQIVRRTVTTGRIAAHAANAVTKMILAREKAGSTALGNGIAFPHRTIPAS